ncbi:ROK family transcriptional regulator [Rhizobium leguminosarum]|uniref:ROK family transcriptional regulator n=1 Tax=Rhizobium leguminosarum TaxID=384 RepID=UPI001C93EE0F|nr:ROK family transcriptional regulator [Rhizobium leguminosarum]MBY5646360.1 ROK family transcriptional regulator [Rhizobium leguminosarum]
MQTSTIRHYHASRIFHAIRLTPGISQREIVRKTGADKSTVSTVIKGFEAAGLIERTLRVSDNRPGRPGEGIYISSKGWLLAGVYFHPDRIDCVIGGLDGAILRTSSDIMPFEPERVGGLVNQMMIAMCAGLGRSASDLLALGVSVPGLVTMAGKVARSPNLGWVDVELRDILEKSIAVPVYIDNDANGAALAESLLGAGVGLDHFIYVESGSGVGGGLVLDGSIYRGASGFGGEIGHNKIVRNGRECHCGKRGCLSAYVADYALLARAHDKSLAASSVSDLADLADSGDAGALEIFCEAADHLGIGLANIANTFNPSSIVLGGLLSRYSRHFVERTKEAFTALAISAVADVCDIRPSALGDGPPLGALAIALYGCTSSEASDVTPWHLGNDAVSESTKK